MHSYAAYGLILASETAIPGFVRLPNPGSPDFEVVIGGLPAWAKKRDPEKIEPFYASPFLTSEGVPIQQIWETRSGRYLLRYSDGLTFAVDYPKRKIWGTCDPSLSPDHVALFLRGTVLGFVLGLRGLVCLHASAVVIDGRAVAFLGAPGAGKSTTALAFTRRGFAALTDDIVAISAKGNDFTVQPGYPRLNLWPAAEVIGRWVEELPRTIPDEDKRSFNLEAQSGAYHPRAAALGALYILDPKAAGACDLGVEPVSGKDAMVSLLANNYGSGRLSGEQRAREFEVLGRILRRLPIRKLRVPREPGRLGDLCEVVLRDYRESAGV